MRVGEHHYVSISFMFFLNVCVCVCHISPTNIALTFFLRRLWLWRLWLRRWVWRQPENWLKCDWTVVSSFLPVFWLKCFSRNDDGEVYVCNMFMFAICCCSACFRYFSDSSCWCCSDWLFCLTFFHLLLQLNRLVTCAIPHRLQWSLCRRGSRQVEMPTTTVVSIVRLVESDDP